MKRTVATGLRLWTLATRFALIFFLAKYLSPSDVGLFGLVSATVAYSVYVLGIDLYTYTNREIIKHNRTEWGWRIKSHFGFLISVSIVVVPLLLILFILGFLPWSIVFWFLAITLSESFSIEFDRMIIAMADHVKASLVIFVRQALLPTVLIPLFLLVPDARSIEMVFLGWIVFNVIAIIIGSATVLAKIRQSTQSPFEFDSARKSIIPIKGIGLRILISQLLPRR